MRGPPSSKACPTVSGRSSDRRRQSARSPTWRGWKRLFPSPGTGTVPGDGVFNIVADLVRLSPGIVPGRGDGKSRFQPLHVGDLALCLRLSLERPETVGHAFELGGPRTWTYREITAEVCRAMGRRRAIVPVSYTHLTLPTIYSV